MSVANERARSEGWSRRLAVATDAAFFDWLYRAGRAEEVRRWGLNPAAAGPFLQQQADWQRRSYSLQFPSAEHWLLLVRDEPAGRLILNEQDQGRTLHIVDLQIAESHRGRGLGGWTLEHVIDRAAASAQAVELRVAPDNRARRLYERLGFRLVADSASGDGGVSLPMRRLAR